MAAAWQFRCAYTSPHLVLRIVSMFAAPVDMVSGDLVLHCLARGDYTVQDVRAAVRAVMEAVPHATLMVNKEGETPLAVATKLNNVPMAQVLLEADPRATVMINDAGETPLMVAAKCKDASMVKVLLEADPRPTIMSNNDGEPPLTVAARNCNIETCKALLDADPRAAAFPDLRNTYALHWAITRWDVADNVDLFMALIHAAPHVVGQCTLRPLKDFLASNL